MALGKHLGGMGICAAGHAVVVAGTPFGLTNPEGSIPKTGGSLCFDGADGHSKRLEVDGREAPDGTPEGGFGFASGSTTIAVDQSNCDFCCSATSPSREVVDQFGTEGRFIGSCGTRFPIWECHISRCLAVDDPYPGQPNYESPNGRLFSVHTRCPGQKRGLQPPLCLPPRSAARRKSKLRKPARLRKQRRCWKRQLNPVASTRTIASSTSPKRPTWPTANSSAPARQACPRQKRMPAAKRSSRWVTAPISGLDSGTEVTAFGSWRATARAGSDSGRMRSRG